MAIPTPRLKLQSAIKTKNCYLGGSEWQKKFWCNFSQPNREFKSRSVYTRALLDFEKKVASVWDPLLDQYTFCYQQLQLLFSKWRLKKAEFWKVFQKLLFWRIWTSKKFWRNFSQPNRDFKSRSVYTRAFWDFKKVADVWHPPYWISTRFVTSNFTYSFLNDA